jgi:hypothetical protein
VTNEVKLLVRELGIDKYSSSRRRVWEKINHHFCVPTYQPDLLPNCFVNDCIFVKKQIYLFPAMNCNKFCAN